MSLKGTINTMPVQDLLGWIEQGNRSGIIKFVRSSVTKTVNILEGKVFNAGSTDPREYFGQFLINFGLITEDQLQKAFETQKATKVLLGKILVMTGLVTEEQVLKMLDLKIRETILDIYLWREGTFEFHDGLLPEESSVVHVDVDLGEINTEGLKRMKEFESLRAIIPDNRCTFTYREQLNKPRIDKRSSAGIIIDMAKRGYTVDDIILRFHSVDYPILHSIFELVQQGWLEVVAPAEEAISHSDMPVIEVDIEDIMDNESPPEPDDYLLQTQSAMQQKDFERAVAILQKGLSEYPYDPDLTDAMAIAEGALTDQLRNELLGNNQIPVLARNETAILTSDEWSPAQRYLLSRIDGRRHIKSIVMVSPLKEVDALLTFKDLIKKGIIVLQ